MPPLSDADFDVLRGRLLQASDVLFAASQALQAAARRYYVVFHCTLRAGQRTGLYVRHAWDVSGTPSQDYRHNEVPDVIETLYDGMRHPGSCVTVEGSTPGIGSGPFTPRTAWQAAQRLKAARIIADYGGGDLSIYGEAYVRQLIQNADDLVEGLRRLI